MTTKRILGLSLLLSLTAVTNALAITAVPELDPGSASMGVALLVGGLAVLTGRRKR